ncbi:MAG: retroviral-like aspartic protease family protein [Alphaproteobacteria bacterium]|nr:retroviral-like aspartic protease family protein [Alphaproteobacteria bacterium]
MRSHRVLFGLALVMGWLASVSARADHALKCDTVQLPSSLVICSDPELLAIADERAQVYRELWTRLDSGQREALETDQARWVREYATRCGVPPDISPQLPPPPSVVDCFKQAGRARIAFLRGYLTNPTGSADQPNVGGLPGQHFGDEIPLTNSSGIYMVPVLLNGLLPLPFVLDSGAADVSLPADVARTLFRTGTIEDDDYIGETSYQLGDGSVMKSARFFLHEIKVGNHSFNHIEANILPTQGTPLLGQSFLSKVGAWSIDNERHVLVLDLPAAAAGPNVSARPQISSVPPESPRVTAFQDGLRDRRTWESWFAGISGEFRDGAEYWAGQRSLSNPQSCYGAAGEHLGEWMSGCLAAKRLLTPTDVRRKSEPEYRAGWNSYSG